jgi:hypothetical protein
MKAALEVLSTKLGGLIHSQILSIILPGSVVLLQIWTLADYPQLPRRVAESSIPSAQVAGVILFLYVAYVVGFCARQFSFFVADGELNLLNRWRSRRRPESVLPFGTRRWGERFYCREAFQHNWRLLRATFGEDWVNRAVRDQPLGILAKDASRSDNSVDDGPPDYRELFHYCKFWLQSNRPGLGTVPMEVEFNLLLSVMMPLALLPLVVHKLSDSLLAVVLVGIASVLGIAVLIRRGNHLRHAEVFNVVRNVLFAHWYSWTALQNMNGVDSALSNAEGDQLPPEAAR